MNKSNLTNLVRLAESDARNTSARSSCAPDPSRRTDPVKTAPSPKDIKQAVRQINREISSTDRFLDFSVNAESGKTIVKIIDRESKKVVEQFPSEDIVQIASALARLQRFFPR